MKFIKHTEYTADEVEMAIHTHHIDDKNDINLLQSPTNSKNLVTSPNKYQNKGNNYTHFC